MIIVDRYLVRLFLKVLFVCFLSLTGLFIVIDAFGNLEEFLSYASRKGSLLVVLCEYYGPRVLTFFDRTAGLLALVACMFAITWMQRSNELLALMAAGVPRLRLVKPLIGLALAVSLLGVINRECLIPPFREALTRNAQDWMGERAQRIQPRNDNVTDILLGGQSSYAIDQRITRPSFGLPRSLEFLGRQLTAEQAYYRPAAPDRPAGYLLDQVLVPTELLRGPSIRLGDRPVILTPSDTPWLASKQCFVVSDVSFGELTASDAVRQFSSSRQLIRGIHNRSLDYGADVRVALHARLVQPLLDLTLLMLGLPVVLSKENRNLFVAAGWGLLVVTAFFLVVLTCHALGNNYLISPATAAWCPLLVLAPLATYTSRPLFE